jgi:hypothetical protein
VVTGVGAQLSLGGEFSELEPIREEAKALVSAVLDRSQSIGVRGEVTRDYLINLGFPADRVVVIGCPSIFYNGARMSVAKGELEAIAVNFTPMDDPRILQFFEYFDRRPENVTFVPQERSLMFKMFRYGRGDAIPRLSPREPAAELIRRRQVAFLTDLRPWLDFLSTQSFVIGTRIHGNIAALIAGTPGHVVVHDTRTLELSRYHDVPHTLISDLTDFDLLKKFDQSDYTALNRNHRARTQVYANFLEQNGLDHILFDNVALDAHEDRVTSAKSDARLPRVDYVYRGRLFLERQAHRLGLQRQSHERRQVPR